MRTNLPVTQKEVLLEEGQLIVSKADLKGQITYVNQAFIDISGFTEDELIGQPHNIVRHPDMPVEAYTDLWRDLKAGRPWTGLVKNRCKNGDHYWVLAMATPIQENGQVTGYLSVRRRPERQQVEAAEQVYREFRENRAGGRQILHGAVVSRAPGPLARLSVRSKMRWGMSILLVATLLVALAGWWGMRDLARHVEELNAQRLQPTQALAIIGRLMADSRTQILLSLQHDPAGSYARLHDHPLDNHLKTIDRNLDTMASEWTRYQSAVHDPADAAQVAAFTQARQRFVEEGLLPARRALADGRFSEANLILLKQVNPLYTEAAQQAEALFQHQVEGGKAFLNMNEETFALARNVMLAMIALAITASILIGRRLIALVIEPLQALIAAFRAITGGDYAYRLDLQRDDEMGKVIQGLQSMQVQLGFNVAETRRTADAMTRIKIALDNVSTGVMIADAQRNIIYTNRSVERMLKTAEPAIRTQLPSFSADRLLGQNIDLFHRRPEHQAGLLARLRGSHTAGLEIGGRQMTVTASPVLNAQGERLGTVAEWRDRTEEVAIEREIADIVEAAAQGDLAQRLDLAGKSGFFAALATGLNAFLDTTEQALSATSEVLARVARGDLTQTVDADFSGIFGRLKDDTNLTIERLREVVGRIQEASESINTAAREIAAGNADLSARTEEQASSLEETSSSMEELNATVRQNADNARQANELASSSNEIAARGGRMVKDVVETMTGIEESSRRIADIIGVINGIAFQTNILALNAAVEAARAGEQGRGFAVVATEVRNLAQRSAAAAKEIKELIDESVGKVEVGARLVDQAGRTMDDVVNSFQRVAALVTEISHASREQSSGIEQVTQAVSQMDEVTQQNAALVEQAAAAAESLEEQARGLVDAVGAFRLREGAPVPRLAAAPAALSEAVAQAPREAAPAPRLQAPTSPRALPPRAAAGKVVLPATLDDAEDEWEEF